jgi:DNA-binding CsgD family transcriptional regulator
VRFIKNWGITVEESQFMENSEIESLAQSINSINDINFYKNFAEYLRNYLPYDNVIVVVFSGKKPPSICYKKTFGTNVFDSVETQYLAAAYLLDPVYQFHLRRGKTGIYSLLEIAPDQFLNSRYYNWYYGQIGITDEISVIKTVGKHSTVTISMGKDKPSEKFFSTKSTKKLLKHESLIMALLGVHLTNNLKSQSVGQSGLPIIEDLIDTLKNRHEIKLSKRQAEVAMLILQGHSSLSIGLNLGVSVQTVKVFRKQLYSKCNLSSQAELFGLMMPTLEAMKR